VADTIEPMAAHIDQQQLAQELVDQARAEGVQLVGGGGLLTGLTKAIVETALEEEMSDHLGYDKHDPVGRTGGNSRNGTLQEANRADARLRAQMGRWESETQSESEKLPALLDAANRQFQGISGELRNAITSAAPGANLAEIMAGWRLTLNSGIVNFQGPWTPSWEEACAEILTDINETPLEVIAYGQVAVGA
jgi:Transposase, Mutator family